MRDKIKVMLTTEGTYPFHQGGVSTWCDMLVHKLTGIDYIVFSIIMNPFVVQLFRLPNSAELIKVPLWGTEEPSEHLATPFSQVYLAKRQTSEKTIGEHFIPLFEKLIREILSQQKDSRALGFTLTEMYKYFQIYDYKKSFKSELTWNVYKNTVLEHSSNTRDTLQEPDLNSLIQSLGWLYRFLNILNTPLPKADVTHSAAAAFCGIPCVVAKVERKTPFLLTEHGVYLREQYLSLSQRKLSSYLNTFLVRLIHSVSGLSYEYADQISPVCYYNTRWEKEFGVDSKSINVIYNGVDQRIYYPQAKSDKTKINKYPTVVAVARIDPVKDIITLIKAAAIVKNVIADMRFIIYGSVSVPDYYEECLHAVKEMELEENFIFAGHTDDVPAVYRSGDLVALSSITEAFPYSVVEAMMCGKTIVATDVGGIKEALGETGIVVSPRQPEQFAKAVITLLENPALRIKLGEEARERALNNFTVKKIIELYLRSYQKLAVGTEEEYKVVSLRLKKQQLLADKGYALSTLGMWTEAIRQFRQAIAVAPESPAVPVILTEIASSYNFLGKYDEAFLALEKGLFLQEIISEKTA